MRRFFEKRVSERRRASLRLEALEDRDLMSAIPPITVAGPPVAVPPSHVHLAAQSMPPSFLPPGPPVPPPVHLPPPTHN
jgi:hypothetical protein